MCGNYSVTGRGRGCTISSALRATTLSMHVMQHVVRRGGNLVDAHAGVKNEVDKESAARAESKTWGDNTGSHIEGLSIASSCSID